MDTIELMNRDPHKMNHFIQVEFDDVLGEPVGTHSIDCVWRNSYKCFTCGKNLAYSIMTFLFGIITGKFKLVEYVSICIIKAFNYNLSTLLGLQIRMPCLLHYLVRYSNVEMHEYCFAPD